MQRFPVFDQLPLLCFLKWGHVAAVVDGAMFVRGRVGSEAFADYRRWEHSGPYWFVEACYENRLCVVDDFGALCVVDEWCR